MEWGEHFHHKEEMERKGEGHGRINKERDGKAYLRKKIRI
jgi:hypothetical protein